MHARGTAVVVAVLLALPAAAQAADITVTTTDDPLAAGSQCSLRQAIAAANADAAVAGCSAGSGADVIHVPASTQPYKLLLPLGAQPDPLEGDLDITTSLTIAGAGRSQTVLDGNGIDRVLETGATAASVTVKNLTITGGRAPSGLAGADGTDFGGGNGLEVNGEYGGAGAPGGAILAAGSTLTLDNVVVSGNAAGDGGDGGNGAQAGNFYLDPAFGGPGGAGGDGGAIRTSRELVITSSLIADNAAGDGADGGHGGTIVGTPNNGGDDGADANGGSGGDGGRGGAIYAVGAAAAVSIADSVIRDNHSGTGGVGGKGGIAGISGAESGLIIGDPGDGRGGVGGEGGDGGAIDSLDGDVTIARSVLSANSSGDGNRGGDGGTGGSAGLGATPREGAVGRGGGGGRGGEGGALRVSGGTLDVSHSEISENATGRGGAGGAGGAGGKASDGTDTGESAGGGGGLGGQGGGVLATGPTTGSITETTLALNATGAGGNGGAGGSGPASSAGGNGLTPGVGALGLGSTATITVDRVTVAANTFDSPGRGGGAGTAPLRRAGADGQPAVSAGVTATGTVDLRRSIVAANRGAAQCVGTFGPGSGDTIIFPGFATCPATSVDPQLGPLRANGGPTQTMVPRAGSPALDAFACVGEDQRGVVRAKGAACDLGAVERSAPGASTGVAGDVTQTGAALAGSVQPGQVPTSYHFEYGTTTAYGAVTPETSAGSGADTAAAAASIGDLAPATTYHYRLVATNPDGVAEGADQTFTTAALPPGPASPPAGVLPVARVFAGVLLARSARLNPKGRAPVKVTCPAGTAGACTGTLTLTRTVIVKGKRKRETLGSARFTVAAGKTAAVLVPIKRSARARTTRASARAVAKDAAGTTKTRTTTVTLTPAKKR